MNKSANAIICVVSALVGCGLVMIYSVSTGKYGENPEQSFGPVVKHLICIALGVGALLAMMNLDYRRLGQNAWRGWKGVLILTLALLVAVLFFGTIRNGARRWFILYGSIAFQPSEVAKIAIPIFVAAFVAAQDRARLRSFFRGFVPGLAVVGLTAGLILLQPDFGTATLIGAIGFITLVVFGVHLGYTLMMILPAVAGMATIAYLVPYMWERVRTFIDPWRDPQGTGYHIIQSLIAIGSGGLWGKGLAWSQQKLWYLPEANTDFIFSIIGEEFGLCGTVFVLVLFALFFREGMRVARNASDLFGSVLAFGITMMISFQALFNIAVTTKAVPTKGISLPFISFGGSSMLFTLAAVGILVNIARHSVERVPASQAAPVPAAPAAATGG